MSEHKEHKREGRAEGEVEPPLEGGEPDAPLEEPQLPTERVVVYGDASATYGSMVAPEVIRPHATKLGEVLEPERQKQEEPDEEELEEELKHRHKEEHKKKGHK
jgi:hypothetical protein